MFLCNGLVGLLASRTNQMSNTKWLFKRKVIIKLKKKNQLNLIVFYLRNMTILERAQFIVRERGGILGLYRGIAPGSLRSFIGNGTAMVVMQWLQKKVTESGLRD